MGYAETYANLIMQQAAQQGRTLQDVANIRAQAAQTSSQAWGRLPGTLAALGVGTMNTILDDKRAREENAIKARAATVAEGRLDLSERNAAEAERATGEREKLALTTEQDRAAAEKAKVASDFLEKNKLSIADTLRAAARGTNDYALRYDTIAGLADLYDQATFGKQQLRQKIVPPDKMTPEGLSGLESLAASIFAGTEKPKPVIAPPGSDVLDPNDPTNVLHSTPKDTPPPRAGTLEYDVVQAEKVKGAPLTQDEIDALKRRHMDNTTRPSAAMFALTQPSPAAIPVTAVRPSPEDGNKPVPGTYFTQNTLYEAAKARVLLNQKPTLQRQSGPMANQSLAAVENTANALAASVGMSIPELQAEYSAERANLRKRVSDLSANESYALSMRTGLDQALKLSRKVTSYDSPTGNKVQNFFKRTLTGDPTLSSYELWVAGVARDYARITVGGADSVAQLYQGAAEKADQLLNPAMNDKQIRAVLESMVQDVNVILRSKRETVEATKKRIANFLNDEPTDVVPPVVDLTGGNAATPTFTPVGALGLKASDGRVLTFKTQAERDKAMREGNKTAPAPKVDWIWDPATQSFKKG